MSNFHLSDARLELFKVGNNSDTPDDTIPSVDILNVQFSQRINRRKDTGRITLANDDGQHGIGGEYEIVSGDRLDFYTDFVGESTGYGDRSYGDDGYGFSGEFRWSCIAREPKFSRLGPATSVVQFSIEDFTFSVMGQRNVYNVWEDTNIAGTSTSILNEALDDEAEEIDRGQIDDVGQVTTYTADGTNLLELAIDLTERAEAVMYGDRTSLVFQQKTAVPDEGTLDAGDIGAFDAEHTEADVANSVRVDGGLDSAIDDSATVQDSYQTVTSTDRLLFRPDTRKSTLDRINIWTRKTGSEEAITVRVQKDEGGSPVAIDDSSSDIVSKTIPHHFLDDDGVTTFLLEDETLPEPRPWVIIESGGDTGQDIGVDSNTTTAAGDQMPYYEVYYSFPVTVRLVDESSVNTHRRREKRIKKDNISNLEEARDVAQEKLNHDAVPNPEIDGPAMTETARQLSPGDKVTMPDEYKRERVEGDYLVTAVTDTYNGAVLTTDITLVEVGSV